MQVVHISAIYKCESKPKEYYSMRAEKQVRYIDLTAVSPNCGIFTVRVWEDVINAFKAMKGVKAGTPLCLTCVRYSKDFHNVSTTIK